MDLIGNRTRDLPACSVVPPQPTTLPRTPDRGVTPLKSSDSSLSKYIHKNRVKRIFSVESEVPMAVTMKGAVFWAVRPCGSETARRLIHFQLHSVADGPYQITTKAQFPFLPLALAESPYRQFSLFYWSVSARIFHALFVRFAACFCWFIALLTFRS
jgi:hypothetical protein